MNEAGVNRNNNKVLIVGTGNVGSHLVNAFNQAGINAEISHSRSLSFDPMEDYSCIIVAVKDDAIRNIVTDIIKRYKVPNIKLPLIAHTSGSVSLETLQGLLPANSPCGVFYPMQTFTKGVNMQYDDIPFFIEGDSQHSSDALIKLASLISSNVIKADSEMRAAYHIGAVLCCNFTNHLCTLADNYLSSKNLDFRVMLPLLRQTISKLNDTPPYDAQTGPAVRNDKLILDYHLKMLSESPEIADIYKNLSESIINLHKK